MRPKKAQRSHKTEQKSAQIMICQPKSRLNVSQKNSYKESKSKKSKKNIFFLNDQPYYYF